MRQFGIAVMDCVQHEDANKEKQDKQLNGHETLPPVESILGPEVMSPRAKAAAASARAAACKVVMTPGGPLPLPAGCQVRTGGPSSAGFSLASQGQVLHLL